MLAYLVDNSFSTQYDIIQSSCAAAYFSLDVEGKNLELDIDDADNEEELKKCRERLKELRASALKLEL